MKDRPVRLQLEVLEGRALPGVAPTSPVLTAPVLKPPAYTPPVAPIAIVAPKPPAGAVAALPKALSGTATGTYICTFMQASTPSGFHFQGTANIVGMGQVSVLADVYGVGFRDGGTARGRVTFTNARGSVTIELTGPAQPKLSALPSRFTYRVISTTGSYTQIKASGELQLIRTKDAIPVRNGIRYHETGSFRLVM